MRARLEEELKRLAVEDVVVQTAVTLVNLGGRRLGLVPGAESELDLDQAKLAVEAVRALMPLLPQEVQPPLRDALSQLQMGFARATQGDPAASAGPAAEAPGDPPAEAPPAAPGTGPGEPGEAERAKARSKIWTPPGT